MDINKEKKELHDLLVLWEKIYHNCLSMQNDLKIFGAEPGSPFLEKIWVNFISLTDYISKKYDNDAFDWYCWENDMGNKKYEWMIDDVVYPIDSLESLVEIVFMWNELKNEKV